jgi:hypothetical protein
MCARRTSSARPYLPASNHRSLTPLSTQVSQTPSANPCPCTNFQKTPGGGGYSGCFVSAPTIRPGVSVTSTPPATLLGSTACAQFPSSTEVGVSQPFQRATFKLTNIMLTADDYPLCFDTVPNSFALCKSLSPVFSSRSTLFTQNTRGGCICTGSEVQTMAGLKPDAYNDNRTGLKTRHYMELTRCGRGGGVNPPPHGDVVGQG